MLEIEADGSAIIVVREPTYPQRRIYHVNAAVLLVEDRMESQGFSITIKGQ